VTIEQVQAAIPEFETLVQKELADTGIPGIAVSIVSNDQTVYTKGFGVKHVDHSDPVDADTVFQLASVSKPLASTIVAAIISDGKITWDSKISDLDPEFQMYDPWVTRAITLRDLFAHRSGLPDHAGDLLEDLGFTRAEILHRLRYQKPDSSFRAGYAYTNFGLTEAAVAAAKSTGKTWEDIADEKLYKPLGMNSTSSRYADFAARPNRAFGHVQVNGEWVQKYNRQPDAQSPAGGVSSSVNDLTKWMRLQIGGGKFEGKQIISADALAETHHPHMLTGWSHTTGLPTFYGLGWNVGYDLEGHLRLNHSGGFELGAATVVYVIPSEQLGIAVLTNASPIGAPESLANQFLDLVVYKKLTQDWSPLFRQAYAQMDAASIGDSAAYAKAALSNAPASSNAAYVGTFTNDFLGDLAIVEQNGGLALVIGPQKMSFPMQHRNRDTFTYQTQGENSVGISGITFMLGADGRAESVLVENLNVNGEGVFKKIKRRGVTA